MVQPAHRSRRARNLGVAAGGVTAVLFALFDLYQWAAAYASDRFHNDFTFYYVAARIGLAHGWPSLYDLQLQQAQLNTIGAGITIAQLARYISPPPLAWLAIPFTVLPYPVAYWTWSALLVGALVAVWWLAAPGEGKVRLILLAAAIGWLPVIYGLQLGQPGLFVAGGVAASYALLRSGKSVWAGIALGALTLKPQLAALVPLALLVAGQRRAFVAGLLTIGVLAAASIFALGPAGTGAYLSRLDFASGVAVNRELTLASLFGNLAAVRAVQLLIAAASLAAVYRLRRAGPEWIFVPALVGGLLATPYLHLDDFVMLGLAGWLALRAPAHRLTWVYVLPAALVVEGEPIWGPLPILIAELAALGLVGVVALGAGPRPPQIAGPPAEPHLTQELPGRPETRPSTPLPG